jgi:hypothetical protein
MSIHKEIHVEDEICADLAAAGWLYEAGDNARYDRTRALFLDDVVAWIQVQHKTKVALAELIAKVNELFEGDLTPGDKLVYVNDVIKGKL